MATYKELYFRLFNALTDAIEQLEAGKIVTAVHLMKLAQQEAEGRHLETDIIPEDSLGG